MSCDCQQTAVVLDLTISDPAGAGPVWIWELKENFFSDHRTIHLIKLMASAMLL